MQWGWREVVPGASQLLQRFLPSLSTVVHPLNQLLENNHQWKWTAQWETAYHNMKEMITSKQVLTHYDLSLPLRLACDAPPPWKLVPCYSMWWMMGASDPLLLLPGHTRTEQGYAQTHKEALAIIWGVKKFHVYLFGQSFTLYTDHQPLTYIFHPHKSIPVVTAARLQCYALFLAGYDHKIEYKNTKVRSNADGLSRPPL